MECACASEWRSCFSEDNFRTFLDLKTTFWLSFYYFLHCTPYLNKISAKSFCVFLCCFFFVFFVFYFIKISKFALPGVMLIYERTSKDRKKERKKERKRPLEYIFVPVL